MLNLMKGMVLGLVIFVTVIALIEYMEARGSIREINGSEVAPTCTHLGLSSMQAAGEFDKVVVDTVQRVGGTHHFEAGDLDKKIITAGEFALAVYWHNQYRWRIHALNKCLIELIRDSSYN